VNPPWLVLLNGSAGRRPLDPGRVEEALEEAEVDATLEVPETVEEVRTRIAGAAREERWRLAVVGGDGTVNLAVNQMLPLTWSTRPVLGVLPSGTGCDLLRTFGIPQDLGQAARHLAGDAIYAIDLGKLEGDWGIRYFANVAQAGVGAAAAETAPVLGRGWGKARYPLAFLARLPGFPPADTRIDLGDQVHESRALAVIFANAQFFAGGWNVAPRAVLNDGRVDLQVINCKKPEALRLVPKIIRGVHLTDRAVRRFSSPAFTLTTSIPWPIEADGDLVGNTPVKVSVVPGALDLKI
jgi:YegS/Rv2252/BmrU family lipid kinase